MKKQRIIIKSMFLLLVLCFFIGCETMDAVMGAAKDGAEQSRKRYGGSKYYKGSSLEKLDNTMEALANLYFDVADFSYQFKAKLTNKYEREILVRELVTSTLVQLAYDSLVDKNYSIGKKIRTNFHSKFIEKVKNKIRYYEYSVRAEKIASDFVDVINNMRSGR